MKAIYTDEWLAYNDIAAEAKTYAYDPHLDPTLQWAGKKGSPYTYRLAACT
jgi:hypothetical protein